MTALAIHAAGGLLVTSPLLVLMAWIAPPKARNDGKPSQGNPKDPKGPPPVRPVKQHPRQPPPPKK